jgi:hypothetical protein
MPSPPAVTLVYFDKTNQGGPMDEVLKSKGRRIVKPQGEREWKCSCCGKKFLYSYEALIHLCR